MSHMKFKNLEFFDKNIWSWFINSIFNYNEYINKNKEKIEEKIRTYRFQKKTLKDIIIESKVKKEVVENSMKILTSVSTAFYVLLLQSVLTIYILYINSINNYAVTFVSSILNTFPKLQQNMDYKKYSGFLEAVKNSFSTFNDGIYKLVMILMICFLGLIFISLFFIYIEAKRKSYLVEMYSYQIEYAKKYLR
ncbi:hypothetical protein HKI81_08185 [Caldanaerobacter subterraneus]|uniref:Uncharacterized protein n=2 Tax=Caldanaerobacter subterraneus TaxID=911092 RepID=A0A7Y2L7I3_9THEO|nr:hypothetical protein [Caldanaerobacter subterraneus]